MADRPVVTISPNNPVFDLPVYVARDEGLFAKVGIEVRYQAKYSERNASDLDAFKRLKESLFEQGKADVYNLCEWAGIDRSQRSCRGAQVMNGPMEVPGGAWIVQARDPQGVWFALVGPRR